MSQFLPWAAFSALRAYSLSISWAWGALVFALSIVPLGINLSHFFVNGIGGINDPVFGCSETFSITIHDLARHVIISRGCLILADIFLIGITLWSIPTKANMISHILKPRSLQGLLIRDGTIYFIVLLTLNVLQLLFTLLSIFGDGFESYVSLFTEPCTAILINRFLLHLQESRSRTLRVDTEHSLHPESFGSMSVGIPSFVRVVGSIAHRDHDVGHEERADEAD
ncbi:hypothetical protein C8Q80DRAFT_248978 [Daedaleopsis nitida]|nr:hypothetical protein C8Q80DRAFT_248978 [Daedaleopsis nitida]